MERKADTTLAPALVTFCGIAVIGATWLVGWRTGWFLAHVVFPVGFWLTFEGLALRLGNGSLLRRPAVLVAMTFAGACFGLLLDFYMVYLTQILDLTAVTDPGIGLQMYLGWGLCLPAVYQSYRVFLYILGKTVCVSSRSDLRLPSWLFAPLGLLGFGLAGMTLFFRLWVGFVPGYLIVTSFLGFWLLAEHVQLRRGRPTFGTTLLQLNFAPILAMSLASLPFTLLWEGLNYLIMDSWHYQNIFLLEPRIIGIPPVVFFGYFCGYYVLFLSLYNAVRTGDEADLPFFGGMADSTRETEKEGQLVVA